MIATFLAYLADFSIFIPVVVAIIRKEGFATNVYRLIGIYCFLILLRNMTTLIMNQLDVYNIYIYNWHNLLGFTVIAIIYSLVVKNYYFKFFAWTCILIVTTTAFIDYPTLLDVKTRNFNQFSYNASGFLTIILTLFYFYQLLQSLYVSNLTQYPLFWFSAGILFYYAGTLFSYLFIETTFNSSVELRQQYWVIDAILSIVLSIFLGISIWFIKPPDNFC
jgi:hypothetical protein